MKKPSRVAENGDTARSRAQSKHGALFARAIKRLTSAKPERAGEEIGTFTIGITKHSLRRSGRRFSLAVHHIERFTGRRWKPIAGDLDQALCDELNRALLLADRRGFDKALRVRVERRPLTRDEAILIVRDKILIPAVGAAIPACFAGDLWAHIVLNFSDASGRKAAQQLHVVGATPVEIPEGVTVGQIGRARRNEQGM